MKRFTAVAPLLLVLAGCGTLRNGRGWGQDAILPLPSIHRIGTAALNAAINPMTWVPAVGAGVCAIDHFDEHVSHWAREKTPIFRSNSNADKASDILLYSTWGAAMGSTLATPSGDDAGDWVLSKARGLAIEGVAVGVTYGSVEALKFSVKRTRPYGGDFLSFPSAHSASAFACATLTSKNLESIQIDEPLRIGFRVGAYSLAAGTAWARVEGGQHFPSDVLVGAAVGHFVAAFIHDAFLGLPGKDSIRLEVGLSRHEAGFAVTFGF